MNHGMRQPPTSLTALLLAPLAMLHAADAPEKSHNILLIVFDDLNNRIGCCGDPVPKSPNLDRFG